MLRKYKVWVEEVETICGYVEVEIYPDLLDHLTEEEQRELIENMAEQKVIDEGMPDTAAHLLQRSATFED